MQKQKYCKMKHKTYKKVALVILDGFGVAPAGRGNAIGLARTPALINIVRNFPSLTLQASGPLVGLPWGEMGNSEVGHLNLGAGRIVGQDLPRITGSIQSGEFFKIPALLEAIEHANKNKSSLHLIGLVSPGGVHSYDEHLYALLGMAAEHNLRKVFVHMFTDGRDTDAKIALESLAKLRSHFSQNGVGQVATISGRFYAMDRGQHWGQTAMAYDAMVEGKGPAAPSAEDAVKASYGMEITDEMIVPTVIVDEENRPVARIAGNDAVIFINFRPDRAIQLSEMFVKPESVPEGLRRPKLDNLYFATMTEYLPDLPARAAFGRISLKNNLAEILSKNSYSQFHIAESEKYAHVTAFFNCGKTDKWPGEDRIIVTSPENNLRNYVDHPEMSAEKLTEILAEKITKTDTRFFVANFANPDMVGHTGHLQSAIEAVEFIDGCLKKIYDSCLLADAALIITADHGNVEIMINSKTGDINKDHTTSPVPFLLVANELKFARPLEMDYCSLASRVPAGIISDIAPTILDLFGLPKPDEMSGINLLGELDPVPQKV